MNELFLSELKHNKRGFQFGMLFFAAFIFPLCVLIGISCVLSIPSILRDKFSD